MGLQKTVLMVALSSLLSYLIGILLGVLLIATDKGGIQPNGIINTIPRTIINSMRSVPFIIMLFAALPLTRFIVWTTLDPEAVVVPLTLATTSCIARVIEGSLKEADAGVVEAVKSAGVSNSQVVRKVILSEARPPLLMGMMTSITTTLGYSTMAGFIDGGGLGTPAINCGYYCYQTDVMPVTVVVLVAIVQLTQESFLRMAWYADKRTRWWNNLPSRRLRVIKQDKNPGR